MTARLTRAAVAIGRVSARRSDIAPKISLRNLRQCIGAGQ
jgi:hypothetical protein